MPFASLGLMVATAFSAAPESIAADHLRADLVSDSAVAAPGKSVTLGLHLDHEPHWHTYWINPGDSGLPTKLAWHLPDGFHAGEIAWPTPSRFVVGDLYNFGYDGDVLLPVKIDIPPDAKIGTTAHIALDASWLVCREECVPGKASLAIDLPIRDTLVRNAKQSKGFDQAPARQPQPAAWSGTAQLRDDRIEVALSGDAIPTGDLDAFVVQRKIVSNAPPKIRRTDGGVTLLFAKSEYFITAPPQIDLLLRQSGEPAHAWSVPLPFRTDHP